MSDKAVIVTGAAGFIGATLVAALNQRGYEHVIAVDDLTDGTKFLNLAPLRIADYWDRDELLERMQAPGGLGPVRAIFHQGACSATTEWDGRYMMDINYRYSRTLLEYCTAHQVPLIYASSAAVYGGEQRFEEVPAHESPLNVYGYSKLQFDNRVRFCQHQFRSQVVGLRYFNVYGPGETHKGTMASVMYHFFNQLEETGRVRLFEGSHGYGPGEQRRDFVYVEDAVAVNLWFMERPHLSGIYNVGTGASRSRCVESETGWS